MFLENTPYSIQHTHNPVDQCIWGVDAFEKASVAHIKIPSVGTPSILPNAVIRAIVTKITKIGGRGDIIRSSGWVFITLQGMGRTIFSDRFDGRPEGLAAGQTS